jgi:Nuclear RNA-splicing-associated protein
MDSLKICTDIDKNASNPLPNNTNQCETNPAPVISSHFSVLADSAINEDNDRKQRQRSMAPMSREEYERQQSQVRQVLDVETGRMRLVRGTGEIIETMVSRAQHAAINQQATRGDGSSFARNVFHAAAKR